MSQAEATTLWARAFVDELARAGVREVVIAPGSRSTPLVLAFAEDGRFRIRVHLDERSAGFFALGVGKASGVPAAVVTTSGTATANLFPAVIEASESEAPLLVLTADRPQRLRGADANQAIDQVRLYGPYPRAFFEAPAPALEGPELRHLRTLACRAVAAARGTPAGPVHVNFPFDKPLEPVPATPAGKRFAIAHPLAARGRPGGEPFVEVGAARRHATEGELRDLREVLARAARGVLVAGPSPEPERVGEAVARLGGATGFPVLADPLSGARFRPPEGSFVVGGYDLILRDPEVRAHMRPDLILRVGASPTSASLQAWLELHNGVRHVVVDGGSRWKDHASVATDYVHADAADTLLDLAAQARPTAEADWTALWGAAASAAASALEGAGRRGDRHEGDVLAAVAAAIPAGGTIFVSNSMAVRNLDAFGIPRGDVIHVRGNRGASGVDGIVSTAFGVASASEGPTVCVIGDIALFHDQNGLLWAREGDLGVVFVLIDNDGGALFHALPIAEYEPHFTTLFATPHGLDFAHAAAMFGVPLEDVGVAGVGPALARALRAGGTQILRIRTDRIRNQRRFSEMVGAVTKAVRTTTGAGSRS